MDEIKGNEEHKTCNIFNCCFRDTSDDFDLDNMDELYNENSFLYKSKNELDKYFLIFPVGIICDEERK